MHLLGSAGLSQAARDLRGVTNVCLRIETDGTLRWFVRFCVGGRCRTFVRSGTDLRYLYIQSYIFEAYFADTTLAF
jgi:hypothetical protein